MTKLENGVLRYDQTESNKLAKKALQQAFPEVDFSVKALSGSGMYSRSRIEWTDGPTEKEVEAIALRFKGYVEYQGQKCHFDFDPSWQRAYSPIFQLPCAQKLADEYGVKFEIVPASKHTLSYIRFTPNYIHGKTPDDLSTLLWRTMKDISACDPAVEPEPAPAPTPAPPVVSNRMTREEYEAKRDARLARLQAAADRAETEGAALVTQARQMANVIPFGQPILVGHHSEKRDRDYRGKIESKFRKGYELHEKAERLRERAKAAERNTAIFSDDPDATEKLADKIKRLEARQEMMKKANKLVRAGNREGLAEMGFSEGRIAQLFQPDFLGRVGFPDYLITNNGATIRATKKRLEQLEARANETTKATTVGDIRVVENVEANRLQLFFPGKPAAEVIKELKSRGFRWTPSVGCWQAYLTNQARWHAECIVGKPTPETTPQVEQPPLEVKPVVLIVGPKVTPSVVSAPSPAYTPMIGDRVKLIQPFGGRLSEAIYTVKRPVTHTGKGLAFEGHWVIVHHGGIETPIHQSRLVLVERIPANFDPELWPSGD